MLDFRAHITEPMIAGTLAAVSLPPGLAFSFTAQSKIAASPSTKNEAGKRSADASSKKGNQWYFGMKVHVGVDASSGLVHAARVTSGCTMRS